MTNTELISWINKMQDILGSKHINSIDDNWKIFYESDDSNNTIKGFCFLYNYHRLPYKDEYVTGKLAEMTIFTFPEYRHQGVATRLVKQAIEYATENRIDIIADALEGGYKVCKPLGFMDATDRQIWMKLS